MKIPSWIIFILFVSLSGPIFSADKPPISISPKNLSDPDDPPPFPHRPGVTIKVPDKLEIENSNEIKDPELKVDKFKKVEAMDVKPLSTQ
jgi:hypothetical protein